MLNKILIILLLRLLDEILLGVNVSDALIGLEMIPRMDIKEKIQPFRGVFQTLVVTPLGCPTRFADEIFHRVRKIPAFVGVGFGQVGSFDGASRVRTFGQAAGILCAGVFLCFCGLGTGIGFSVSGERHFGHWLARRHVELLC